MYRPVMSTGRSRRTTVRSSDCLSYKAKRIVVDIFVFESSKYLDQFYSHIYVESFDSKYFDLLLVERRVPEKLVRAFVPLDLNRKFE